MKNNYDFSCPLKCGFKTDIDTKLISHVYIQCRKRLLIQGMFTLCKSDPSILVTDLNSHLTICYHCLPKIANSNQNNETNYIQNKFNLERKVENVKTKIEDSVNQSLFACGDNENSVFTTNFNSEFLSDTMTMSKYKNKIENTLPTLINDTDFYNIKVLGVTTKKPDKNIKSNRKSNFNPNDTMCENYSECNKEINYKSKQNKLAKDSYSNICDQTMSDQNQSQIMNDTSPFYTKLNSSNSINNTRNNINLYSNSTNENSIFENSFFINKIEKATKETKPEESDYDKYQEYFMN